MIICLKFNIKLFLFLFFYLFYILCINVNIDMEGNILYIFNYEVVIFFLELGVVVIY